MATATLGTIKQPKLVEKVTEVKEVTLTLSENEAKALMALFYKTGGPPHNTPRKFILRITEALKNAGIGFPSYCNDERLEDDDGANFANGNIYFSGKFPFTPEELAGGD